MQTNTFSKSKHLNFYVYVIAIIYFSSPGIIKAQFVELRGIGLPQQANTIPFAKISSMSASSGNNCYVVGGMMWNQFGVGSDEYYSSFNVFNADSNLWYSLPQFPTPRANGITFTIDGELFSGLGDGGGNFNQDLWKYDTINSTWIQLADYPAGPIQKAASFVLNHKAYIVTGMDPSGNYNSQCWEYDPSMNTWTIKNNFPATARINAVSYTINSRGYVGLGKDSLSNVLFDIWEYDEVNDSWLQKSNFPGSGNFYGRYLYFSIDSFAYLHDLINFWRYDPSSDSWVQKSNFVDTPSTASIGYASSSKGYVLFNKNDQVAGQVIIYEYNPTSDSWTKLIDNSTVTNHLDMGITMNNKVYFYNLVYDPLSDTWTDDTLGVRWIFTHNDKGYAYHNGNTEEFDPVSSTWTPIPGSWIGGSFLFVLGDSAYFLGDDSITGTQVLNKYDINNNSWQQKARPPIRARASFSIGNKGYMGTGPDSTIGLGTSLFYEYDPVSDAWTRKADVPGPRITSYSLATNTKGFIGFGIYDGTTRGSNAKGDLYAYDPVSDFWQQAASLSPRDAAFGFVFNNVIYCGGGDTRSEYLPRNYYDFYYLDTTYLSAHHVISGHTYFDVNNNGLYDSTDVYCNNIDISISPLSYNLITNSNGDYSFLVLDNSYTVTPIIPLGYHLTSTPGAYNIMVNGGNITDLDFGIYPDTPRVADVQTFISSGLPRCNTSVSYWISGKNTGVFPASGILEFRPDSQMIYLSSVPSPDSIIIGTYYYHYSGLSPFSSQNLVAMNFNLPGAGNSLNSVINMNAMDSIGNVIDSSSNYLSQLVLCSFDPNEKISNPSSGVYSDPNSWLTYTVYFQNIGTDTAFNVSILDTLDAMIEAASLEILESSHDYTAEIHGNSIIRFTFGNILLPGSGIDSAASLGHITYRVKPNSEIQTGSQINNTAYLYFDLNPLINTNTTVNTICETKTPTITITNITSSVCIGDTMTFIANIANGGSAPLYQWRVNGISAGTNDSIFSVSTLTNRDTVSCELQSSYLCASPTTVSSNLISVVVHTPIQPIIVFSSGRLESTPASSYQWYLDSLPIVGAVNQFYTPSINGSYHVETIDTNGCRAISIAYMFTSLDIKGISNSSQMAMLYPNPSRNQAWLTLQPAVSGTVKVSLINTIGEIKKVLFENQIIQNKTLQIPIETYNLDPGVYMVQIWNGGDFQYLRLLVIN